MYDDISIRVEDLWVQYRAALDKKQTLKGMVSRLGRRQRQIRIVEALRGVSFEVPRGSVLGVVGANGAGKSTLLRAIAGILPPSRGRIIVRGRVSTLLALGVGMNAQLSGRENIFIGGLAAGLTTEEIERRYDEIVAFSELEDFIDLPLKTYSSGMRGRLGFAVAVHMDPDILLIDEALSAGDARFRRKSFDKMKQLCGEDRTIVLVSHGLSSVVEMADRAIWLHKGELLGEGDPEEIVKAYTDFMEVKEDAATMEEI